LVLVDLAVSNAPKPDVARSHGFRVRPSVKPKLIWADMIWRHLTSQNDSFFNQDQKYRAFAVKMRYSMNALLRVL